MMNILAKSLVLLHTVMSVAAMTWAISVILVSKDFGFSEPRREEIEHGNDGTATKWARHASEYDKSTVALEQADRARKMMYVYVKPALEELQKNEPYLYSNHLSYLAELERLQKSPGDIKVFRLKEGGLFLEVPVVGRPVPEGNEVAVGKSLDTYRKELAAVNADIAKTDKDIQAKLKAIKTFTGELTGTDEANQYIHPGLYQLADREFKAQSQLKVEIDEVKPHWSQALERARQLRLRRTDLELTLNKLKAVAPKVEK